MKLSKCESARTDPIHGGTASALGGGKFANGAWTAAFQHLLNNEAGWLRAWDVLATPAGRALAWAFGAPNDNIVTAGEAAGATLDGWIPFWEPIGNSGGYDMTKDEYAISRALGATGRDAALLAVGPASFGAKSAYFWGGAGTSAEIAAGEATAIGAQTLGQTVGGRVATTIATWMGKKAGYSYPTIEKYIWTPASRMFAGEAGSYAGLSGPGGPLWHTVEKPILQMRKLIPW